MNGTEETVPFKEKGKDDSIPQDHLPQKSTFKRNIDFLMHYLGMSIGLGNVWRFPYLCYKNGGGVFLVAYLLLLIIFVLPIVILEASMGQYTRSSAVRIWSLVPVMRGIGYAGFVILIYSNTNYPVIMAWALRWIWAGFSMDTPWMTCGNTWNSQSCVSLADNNTSSRNFSINHTMIADSNETKLSSVEEFWRNNIIGLSGGLEDMGGLKWDLAACLFVIWILVYFSTWKGIQWTSQIVYVTATLPIVMILLVLIRGVTLEGAAEGINEYLTPNMTKLGEFEVWMDAANQVTFTCGVGYGSLATLSSHNKFHHNVLRDALLVALANGAVSFISGFAIFSVLGHLALQMNSTVPEVAESGPGLVFIAYPTALSFLPAPNFWIVLFFLAVIFLGLDTQFVIQDGVFECTKDLIPRLFRHKWSNEIGHAIFASVLFLLGLSMVSRGGMYIFHIINTYSVAGWCIFFVIFCETFAIGWIYGADKHCDNIREMVPWRVPRMWFILSWKVISPLITLVLLIYSLCSITSLTYDKRYVYPPWANVIAWVSAFSSVICVPITAAYVICKTEGNTLWKKIMISATPKAKIQRAANGSKYEEKQLCNGHS